jgi:hypothetical protein
MRRKRELFYWGDGSYDRANTIDGIQRFCTDALDGANCGQVTGPDGAKYNVAIAARLVPVNQPVRPPIVLIEVEGGCVSEVSSSEPIEVVLFDWDNIKAGDPMPAMRDAWEASDDAEGKVRQYRDDQAEDLREERKGAAKGAPR